MLFKYIVKNVAWAAGKTATFMPKPLFGDNGSGMHCHQSLWKDGDPLFYDELGYAGLSDMARWYIGGLLQHAPVAARVHQPDDEQLPPPGARLRGAGQPGLLASATARPASASRSPARTRRPSASSSGCRTRRRNPYLAFSAMLMAGLDGIKNKIEPEQPVDKDLYELAAGRARRDPAGARLAARGAHRARGRPRLPAPRAASSPTTSSRPGSTTSGPTRSTRSGCARTRTSSSCTTTSEIDMAVTSGSTPGGVRSPQRVRTSRQHRTDGGPCGLICVGHRWPSTTTALVYRHIARPEPQRRDCSWYGVASDYTEPGIQYVRAMPATSCRRPPELHTP